MTFTQSIKTCFRKYITFSGRASRSEYWWFFLFCLLGGLLASTFEAIVNTATNNADGPAILSAVFSLATFIPSLAAGWRRMHDTGRSGLYLLYPLIAFLGVTAFGALTGMLQNGGIAALETASTLLLIVALIVLVASPLLVLWWLTRPSQPGPNQYGPNPHEVTP